MLIQPTAALAAPEHLSRYTKSLSLIAWVLLHFIFFIMLSVYYFLTEVRVKFIPCCGSTVTELEMLVKKEQCTLFLWAFCFWKRGQAFTNAKHKLSLNLAFQKILALETLNPFLFLKIKTSLWLSASESWTSDIKN